MGWLTSIFQGKSADARPMPAKGSGRVNGSSEQGSTGLGNDFDPGLIHTLKTDHQELLSMYKKIGTLLQQGEYEAIKRELTVFKTRLESHLLTENYRLYAYLEERLSSDEENAELMRDFRREMRDIAKAVMNFIRTYTQSGVNASNAELFERDYKAVGERLKQRIMQEENNLYPMYTPPSH